MDPNEPVKERDHHPILAAVFDAAFDLLLVIDPAGVISRVGGETGSVGDPGSLVGSRLIDYVDPASRNAVHQAIAALTDDSADAHSTIIDGVACRFSGTTAVQFTVRLARVEGGTSLLVVLREVGPGDQDDVQRRIRQERLETSNRQLEEFASVAAHDLQEPVRKIRTFSDRIRVLSADSLDAQALGYLDRLDAAAARMQTLISDVLALARISRMAPRTEWVDLSELLAKVTDDLSAPIEESGASIVLEHLEPVLGDPSQLTQLFTNVVSNAVKYRRPDVPPRVVITTRRSDERVEVAVSDNGIGFDDKYLTKIFEPFERLHGRSEYGGTGIGLALCRAIVQRHGGSITAHGTLDEGAVVTFDLPAAHQEG